MVAFVYCSQNHVIAVTWFADRLIDPSDTVV